MIRNIFFTVILLFIIVPSHAQVLGKGNLVGFVKDKNSKPIPGVFIWIDSTRNSTITSDSGYFSFHVPYEKLVTINFSIVGFVSKHLKLFVAKGEIKPVTILMDEASQNIEQVNITDEMDRSMGLTGVNPKNFDHIPNPSGNFESIIKSMPGVSSSNELSSQYSVRGGNFDENLVYVNDIEIFRPYLIRSGEQEGLSFINPDLVSTVKFSAGGFEAKYGDKMASVLDVGYRKPTRFSTHESVNLLGALATVEGVSKNKKLTWIAGARYKNSEYLISSLQTQAEYRPSFYDVQTYLDYAPSSKYDISFLGNFAQNNFNFVPQSLSTLFGTFDMVYNLNILYFGKEADQYLSSTEAICFHYKPNNNLSLKYIVSAYADAETVNYDIQGYYDLNELNEGGGMVYSKDSAVSLGWGNMLSHARDQLYAYTYSFSHIGTLTMNKNIIKWSAEARKELMSSNVSEWSIIDSADYLTPYHATQIIPYTYAYDNFNLSTIRILGYLQDAYTWKGMASNWYLNGGLRFNYWSYSKELLWSPRIRLAYKPLWNKDFIFSLATGIYNQPPSYKEMINPQGVVNQNIKAQHSFHVVLGSDYNLKLWNRPFKFTSELYYKRFTDLIPYTIDNLQIVYTAQNNAVGYATGLDLKINGEFVKGVESWMSLSIMQSMEKRNQTYLSTNGTVVQPGYYPMPNDQLINFNMFFQDYLPSNPSYQAYLSLSYGSPLPVTPPNSVSYNETFTPDYPYRRVDIGICKVLKNDEIANNLPLFSHIRECTFTVEIFNLLNIDNIASFLWIRTVQSNQSLPAEFAVPSYLTTRRINLKFSIKF